MARIVRMRGLGLAAAVLLALVVGASCGSGGDPVEPQPTPTSTRAERAETVEQQAAQEQVEETVAAVGENWRAVAPMARNVVGDPEAPVLIVEYSDFQ